jgi:hypothetical protein
MVIASCTWSTASVNALLAGLIGIAATLLGSFTTYLFQSRTAERAQAFERAERLRYEQVNACSAYATAMTELKRGLITLWFNQRRDAAGADYLATRPGHMHRGHDLWNISLKFLCESTQD